MNKVAYHIASFVMALVMILGNTINAKAAGNIYYVSLTGSDTNPGTAAAPFRTFAKANSVLTPGSSLYIYAGTYYQPLKISKSGTSTAWITVSALSGAVVIDLQRLASPAVELRASYVTLIGIEVRNSSDVCVNLAGTNITVTGLAVHDCRNHGIQANNSLIVKILNSRVYRNVLSNSARMLASGWGSGIKVRESNYVLIQGNAVYNNYGEGIGTRGTNVMIRANLVFNNYSANIYTNSENALVERNFVYCTANTGFERSGLPAVGIGLGEEYFAGWGARLKNARVLNNIVSFCRNGVRYMGADAGVVGGGLKNAVIAYNTLYGSTNAAISIAYESAQAGSLIANNIFWQAQNNLTAIDSPVGLTFQNNLWKVAPAAAYRGPGDRYGDPKFINTPAYTIESYRPSSASPAAMTAAHIGVLIDYYARTRGPVFDMGAIQFSSASVSSNTQEVSGPTPTLVQPTNTLPTVTSQNTVTPFPPIMQPTNITAPVNPTLVSPTVTSTSLPPTVPFTATPVGTSTTTTLQPALPQETTYDNTHSAFVYSPGWAEEVKEHAISGSFAQTSTNGSSVTFQFTGQSFSILYKGGPSYRKMDVYVDNVLAATFDERLDVSTYKARWDFPGQLSSGPHTLKLVFVTTGSSTNGSLDAVIVR